MPVLGEEYRRHLGLVDFYQHAWPLGTGAGLSGVQKCHQPGRKIRDERNK